MASLAQSQPWLAEGISRATWFRRQKEKGSPDGRQKQKRFAAPKRAEPVIDAAIPRNALLRASGAELAAVRAKAAAIGPGAVITKTDGRFDVVTSEAFEARHNTPTAPSRPPASMFAIGGKPGRGLIPQGQGYPAPPDIAAKSIYGQFMSRTEMMLAALAAKSDEQEKRIAALEAQAADRQLRAVEFAKAFVGAFKRVVAGR
jgi:hypothetical protein